MSGRSQGEVEVRVSEFVDSIKKYQHLSRQNIDLKVAADVEAVQQAIISSVREKIVSYPTLRDAIEGLREDGSLGVYASMAAEVVGEDVPDLDDALSAALEGELDRPGVRSTLIALQAVARAYSEGVQSERGLGHQVTGVCSLCGAKSETMVRRGGDYLMVCHFCSYMWVNSRDTIICPYCGNDDPLSIGVYSDRSRRVALARCQECESVWRVILDDSIRAPPIILPLIALGAEAFRRALPE